MMIKNKYGAYVDASEQEKEFAETASVLDLIKKIKKENKNKTQNN